MMTGVKTLEAPTPEAVEEIIRENATPIPEGYTLCSVGYTLHGAAFVVVAGPGLPAMACTRHAGFLIPVRREP